MLRTHDAGSLAKSDVGSTVVLAGWVARRRDPGGAVRARRVRIGD